MRNRSPLLPFALLLAVAAMAPAHAQRVSLADRVAALEARAADNSANVDLLNQVGQLRTELQALRGQLEELQQQNQQLQALTRSQYLDVDDRLNRLEGGAGTAPATPAPAASVPSAAVKPSAATAKPAAASPAASVQEKAPVVYGDKGMVAAERAAYDEAFAALKAGHYTQSVELFQNFLQQYPNGSYTPNALYWLGESFYVSQNYSLAQQQFQAVLDRYPTHDKAPGAELKVGLCQYNARQFEAAERTLSDVTRRYPGTDVARTAADHLSAIRLGHLAR